MSERLKRPRAELTVDRLRSLLNYDGETGTFTWRVSRGPNRAGALAGSLRKDDYVDIGIDGRLYLAHRLAWLYVHGRWPAAEIDHRDHDRGNQKIANLRESTRSQNMANARRRRASGSGIKGVSWHRTNRRWVARVYEDGREITRRQFTDIKDAADHYARHATATFGEFASYRGEDGT